jgi:uncharacterized protein (TIGR03000 family)
MLRKWFLVPVLGSLAVLFVAVDVAQAQLRDRIATARERRMERRDSRRGIVTQTVVAPSVQASSTARLSYYPTPASEGMADAARIRVILPDAQARVLFDDTATKQIGADRLFLTPALTAGAANKYLIRATFMQNGREVSLERDVTVAPGRTYVVDFTRR